MFSQGPFDVAFFMTHSLEIETRRAHEESAVKHYWDVHPHFDRATAALAVAALPC